VKTIVLTGGNRGLGRATVDVLAGQGHRIIFTARDEASGRRALDELRARHPRAELELRMLDLSALDSVRAFAAELESRTIDVLFHNAGVMQQSPTRRLTKDGFEETLGVNVLAPFLLTKLLLPSLERAPAARVVCVSSRLHLPGSRGVPVDFDFDDPLLERGYHPERAYKNSKLAMLWFAFELNRRLASRKITANAVCPGFVPVTAAESTAGFQKWLMRKVLVHMPFAVRVEDAAGSFAFMAADPSLEGVGGKLFGEKHPIDASPDARDEAKARRFWDWACGRVGVADWP
jgi:NAD(P)-dependent dehydrogenase (short-subunit alcohol dehydrogenase family)